MKIRAFAPAFLCLLVMGVHGAEAATTWVVDDDGVQCHDRDFSTISAAVAVASPGDTIQVCAGSYVEQVQINKNNLTLLGAQAGVDARTRPFVPDPTTQSIIEHPCGPVQITADQDTLDGFTVQGSTLPDPCFLAGIWTNPGFSGTQGGHQILNNIVQNNISGIELDSTCMYQTLVQFNLIQNNSNPGPGSGNGIQTNFGLCNAKIDSNKFSGDTSSSVLVVAPSSNLNVTNNELVGGTPESIAFITVSTAMISGNVSIGSTSSGTIDLFGGDSNITVNGNTLFNGMRGIVVENPYVTYNVAQNSNIAADLNCIQGNSVAGMEVDLLAYPMTPQLNAENNWWGSASGPNEIPRHPSGTGDKIIDLDQNVDFDPWLTSCAAPTMVTGGGQVPVNLTGGQGTFGFNAKQDTQSGHLNYMNHVTGAHLDCTVDSVTITSSTMAEFSGTCSPNSTASSFMARVEDNAEPGKNADKFFITYGIVVNEGGTLTSGNIKIHK